MNEVDLSNSVARLLAWVFPRHRDPVFLDYLAITYSQTMSELPRFEALCVAEAEYGDVEIGAIGGIMKRCWLADQAGFRSVQWHALPPFVDDFDDAERSGRTFYRFPLIKFLLDGVRLTFGEAFGPELACRKLGRVRQTDRGIGIVDVQLLWNVKSLGSKVSLPPLAPALDIDEGRDGEPGAVEDRDALNVLPRRTRRARLSGA